MKTTPIKDMKKNQQKPGGFLSERHVYGVGMALCVLLFTGMAYYLTAYHNYNFLLKTQEQSLFMYTYEFFQECMQRAGGLLAYGGCFLTQFFYYPWLGSTFYVVFLLGIVFMTTKAFRIQGCFLPLAFLPSLLLLLSYTDLGYLIFILKSPGYVFSNPLGVVVALGAFWTYRVLRSWVMRGAFVLLFIVLSYPLFGFYTLLAGGLCSIYELASCFWGEKKGRIYPALIAGAAWVLVPYIYFIQSYTRMLETEIYWTALPRFYFQESELGLWMPFILLFMCLFCFLAFLWMRNGQKRSYVIFAVSMAVYGICVWKVYGNSYNDENFRTAIDMDVAASRNDWNGVLECASRLEGEPTRLIVLHTNLALQKLGLAGDQMFRYKNASQPYEAPRPSKYLRDLGAKPLYFQYGDINFAYRWCMEDAVEFGWKVEYLKYMAKCALMNKEYALVKKYTGALKETLFHKDWAEKYEAYAAHPERMKEDPEFKAIQPLTEFGDVLDGDGGMVEFYLLNNFAMMEGGSMDLVELSLQSNLILKNIEGFWPRFFLYARYNDRIPVHYQEAALLYSYLEGKVDVSGLNFDSGIVDRFNELIRLSKEFSSKGEEYCKVAFAPSYGDTFWYYYFFVKGLKTN